jgi:hypothetical protein
MEDWKPEEWQGRSKENYESSALAVTVAISGVLLFAVIYILTKLI